MIIDSVCPPAVLYLGFSLIQIIIDLFRGQQNSAFLKVIVMIVFTILLNQLCMGGLTILSWFIVFIPFIMMTYVTTILLYVFGLNPSKGKLQPQQPDPRGNHATTPTPSASSNKIGGCATTLFGCCPNGVTARNMYGSNCNGPKPAKWYRSHQGSHYHPHSTTTPTPTSTTRPSTTPTPTSTTRPSPTPTTAATTAPPAATTAPPAATTAPPAATTAPPRPAS